uniref:Uncharacterized protein n=1 Tax=Anopheles dirus TaxID=7168 RepID=A0A182NB13_9DIPT
MIVSNCSCREDDSLQTVSAFRVIVSLERSTIQVSIAGGGNYNARFRCKDDRSASIGVRVLVPVIVF